MRLTVTSFITLDGVVQAPGGPDEDRRGGFELGGWAVPFADDEVDGFVDDVFDKADAFLLGRGTYESWAGYWPAQGDRTRPSTALNSRPKHVASTTLTETTWPGSSLLEGDLPDAVRALKAQPGRELQVHGSAGLVHSLAALDLIDGYRFIVAPVVAGSGIRLLEAGSAPVAFRLASSQTTSRGVALQTYERTGSAETGTWSP
jgi:dihydrofolate reductase